MDKKSIEAYPPKYTASTVSNVTAYAYTIVCDTTTMYWYNIIFVQFILNVGKP